MAEQNLKDKTVRGVGWSAVDNLAQYIVGFFVSIVLARLLSPDDYGLLGLTAIFVAVCNTLIYGGFGAALIRKKNVTDEDYNTVFIVNIVMSALLYGVIFLCSPLIAVFFGRQELVLLVRVSSLGMIVGALAFVQQTRLTKQIDFKQQTKITFAASVVSGVVGIGMALLGCGVWSLVVQGLLSHVVRTLLLWHTNKWVPKLSFSITSFKELFGFGWKMMVSGLLDTIWKELYQVIVGKYYSPATLGQYTRAKHFSTLLSSNLTTVVQRVTYPVLSNIQDDKTRMKMAYRRIIKLTMFVTVVSMFFLGAISEPLLFCLIGPKWNEAAKYLPLICIAGSLYPLHAINLNMLQVQGRSDLFLVLEFIKKVIALGPLFVGAFVGVMPMLYTNVLTGIISYFLNSHYSGKFLSYSSWMQIKDIGSSFGIALAVALPVYLFKFLPISNWVILPIQLVFGGAGFFLLCKITQVEEYKELKEILMPYLKRIKTRRNE